jgi:hypothetical protein
VKLLQSIEELLQSKCGSAGEEWWSYSIETLKLLQNKLKIAAEQVRSSCRAGRSFCGAGTELPQSRCGVTAEQMWSCYRIGLNLLQSGYVATVE